MALRFSESDALGLAPALSAERGQTAYIGAHGRFPSLALLARCVSTTGVGRAE